MRRLLTDLALVLALFTRLPVGRLLPRETVAELGRTVWAYPVAGALVGGLGGLAYMLVAALGVSPPLAAGWTLAVLLLVTGGLHEDGLADTADGLGGGRDAARKLAIMRDSRIGSYGALALVLSLGLRGAAIAEIATPGHVAVALVVAGALGRAAIVMVLLICRPARPDGLAAQLGRIPLAPAIAAFALAGLACLLLPHRLAWTAAALAIIAAIVTARLATRQIGGHTGDILGATAVITECLVLTALTTAG